MSFDLIAPIKSLGYAGIWATLFLECGVPFFFFLPGDSLLFMAGFLGSQNVFNIWVLVTGCFVFAILGETLGYYLGQKVGMKLFEKGDTRFIKIKHLEMTQRFFEKHGAVAVITARFMPIIRTFTPFLAGMAGMNFRTFMLYNVIGAALWAVGLPLLGFFFGKIIPPEQVDQYLLPIILLIIVISFLPSIIHFWKEHKHYKNQK
jgi:membrane-associated protein